MNNRTWTRNKHAEGRNLAGRLIKLVTFGLLSVALTSTAFAGPREQAKRIHDRLAGVPPTEAVLQLMEADVAAGAVATLVDDGLQSDARFVAAFVRSRINQGKGPAKIRADLREKGVDDGITEDGIREADQDWYALAVEVRLKKFGAERPADFKEKARQMRFLQSRGFEQDQIQSAVSASGE